MTCHLLALEHDLAVGAEQYGRDTPLCWLDGRTIWTELRLHGWRLKLSPDPFATVGSSLDRVRLAILFHDAHAVSP